MSSKSEDLLNAWAEFFVAHALAVREVEASIAAKAPLSLDEYDLLLVLSRTPGHKMRFSILAEATIYTRSGITRIVKRLEKLKYLRRERCSEDRRGSFAVLTEAGKKALSKTWDEYSAAVLSLLGKTYTQSEALKFAQLSAKLIAVLRPSVLVKITTCSSEN